jgi:hypothetical protein
MNLWIPYIETVNNVRMLEQIKTAKMEEIMTKDQGKDGLLNWRI